MKKISKLLTALVVTAMMFSFFGSSAFAAPTPVKSQPTIVKTVASAAPTKLTKDDTYTFEMIYTGTKGNVGNNKAVDPEEGTTPQTLVLTGKATLPLTSADNATQPLSGYTFTAPGTYDFTIQETAVSNPHVNLNNTKTTLRAVVTYAQNDQTNATDFTRLNVAWYIVNSDTEKTPLSNQAFTIQNTMKGGEAYTTATITKIVKGNLASPDDSFEILVKVTGYTGTTQTYSVSTPDGNTTITSGTENKFTLKAGQSIIISGLLTGTDKVSVNENLPDNSEYTMEGINYRVENGQNQEYTGGTEQTMKEGKNIFEITNKCDSSFTGYVTTILPYAIIAVIAVAGIVIVRKRRAA